MNITTLTESPNRLITDQELPNLPVEIANVVKDPDYSFYAFGPIERDVLYDFSGNQLYRKDNGAFERLDFTGELYFGDIFFLDGEKDLELVYQAVFIKGSLESIAVHHSKSLENTGRKKTMQAILTRIEKRNKLFNNKFFQWTYLPYKICVNFVFSLVRGILFCFFKVVDVILSCLLKILTPW